MKTSGSRSLFGVPARIAFPVCVLLCAAVFGSCASIGARRGRSWIASAPESRPRFLFLRSAVVDRTKDASSIENEIRRIVPLLFLDHGFAPSREAGDGVFLVDIHASERDVETGFDVRLSTAVDVTIRAPNGELAYASRVDGEGSASLASSPTLYSLLAEAVRLAAFALRKAS